MVPRSADCRSPEDCSSRRRSVAVVGAAQIEIGRARRQLDANGALSRIIGRCDRGAQRSGSAIRRRGDIDLAAPVARDAQE
jgi:hypothetical protein